MKTRVGPFIATLICLAGCAEDEVAAGPEECYFVSDDGSPIAICSRTCQTFSIQCQSAPTGKGSCLCDTGYKTGTQFILSVGCTDPDELKGGESYCR